MKTNYPYRSKQHSPIKPMSENPNKGEYTGSAVMGMMGKSCMPKKGENPTSSMHQSLYGGKKPA
jgi:hypothetical protein